MPGVDFNPLKIDVVVRAVCLPSSDLLQDIALSLWWNSAYTSKARIVLVRYQWPEAAVFVANKVGKNLVPLLRPRKVCLYAVAIRICH